MKVIALNGSPRTGGNTDLLLMEAVRAARDAGAETEIFNLNSMAIKPCQDCGFCTKSGRCIIKDDMYDLYDAIRRADRIILGSPIFFFNLSAQAKTMIDRCQSFWSEKYLLKKEIPSGANGRKGLLLLVGAMKNETGVQCSEAVAKAFFRTISVPHHETLTYLEIDAKGAIIDHPTALSDAYAAGKKLILI
ncbi:MAG: flavodoxin family protein [Dissulfurispiraceae bacterium]|jgi:multimeric flavodoxin WrbA|nr:flavodoxin family protein [Dissulfurispiraceae bacterium]